MLIVESPLWSLSLSILNFHKVIVFYFAILLVIKIHPLGTMGIISTKLKGNPSSSCQDISIKNKYVNLTFFTFTLSTTKIFSDGGRWSEIKIKSSVMIALPVG